MKKQGNILIIDDNQRVLTSLKLLLEDEFGSIITLHDPGMIPKTIAQKDIDLILLDMNFSSGINTGNEGIYWLRKIKKIDPGHIVVMITAYADINLAVKSLKEGASDFITKPWDNEKLIATLKSSLELRKLNKELKEERGKKDHLIDYTNKVFTHIIGSSKPITTILGKINKVAATDASILLTGENGTGKELFAREIHRQSNRSREVFINVDVGALSETLFESEMFGHKKGAFTDAIEDKIGKFELANKGTLFLDEIGNLSLAMQAKLLKAIQNKEITRVGSNISKPVDVRLICATNQDVAMMLKDKLFRKDLYYRINTVELHLPQLKDRKEDIPSLANFFLERYAAKYHKRGLKLSTDALDTLMAHEWPGNVRELDHTIEKAVIFSENDRIKPQDLHLQISIPNPSKKLSDIEKHAILNSLRSNNGNMKATANELGITRQTLYNKIKKYDL